MYHWNTFLSSNVVEPQYPHSVRCVCCESWHHVLQQCTGPEQWQGALRPWLETSTQAPVVHSHQTGEMCLWDDKKHCMMCLCDDKEHCMMCLCNDKEHCMMCLCNDKEHCMMCLCNDKEHCMMGSSSMYINTQDVKKEENSPRRRL